MDAAAGSAEGTGCAEFHSSTPPYASKNSAWV